MKNEGQKALATTFAGVTAVAAILSGALPLLFLAGGAYVIGNAEEGPAGP